MEEKIKMGYRNIRDDESVEKYMEYKEAYEVLSNLSKDEVIERNMVRTNNPIDIALLIVVGIVIGTLLTAGFGGLI